MLISISSRIRFHLSSLKTELGAELNHDHQNQQYHQVSPELLEDLGLMDTCGEVYCLVFHSLLDKSPAKGGL